jgi:ATP-dependent Clp protease protease subunit
VSWGQEASRTDLLHAALTTGLEAGVDLLGRRLYVHGDIDEDSCAFFLRGLNLLVDAHPRRPIEVWISSYGGDIYEAMSMHDAIRSCPAPVHTFATGKCMSAAPYILAAGALGHRYAAPSCQFMCHAASMDAEGHPSNVAGTADAIHEFGQMMDRKLAALTNRPYSHWSRISRTPKDHYFTSKQALEWGLIDEIWAPEAL